LNSSLDVLMSGTMLVLAAAAVSSAALALLKLLPTLAKRALPAPPAVQQETAHENTQLRLFVDPHTFLIVNTHPTHPGTSRSDADWERLSLTGVDRWFWDAERWGSVPRRRGVNVLTVDRDASRWIVTDSRTGRPMATEIVSKMLGLQDPEEFERELNEAIEALSANGRAGLRPPPDPDAPSVT
jgi:hypothetical protein